MIGQLQFLDEVDSNTVQVLMVNVRGVTEAELDWERHPQANSVRSILGRPIWSEEWFRDTLFETGRHLTDDHALSYDVESIDEIHERFDCARRA